MKFTQIKTDFSLLSPNKILLRNSGWILSIKSQLCSWATGNALAWSLASSPGGWHISTWMETFSAFFSSYLYTTLFHSILPPSGSCCNLSVEEIPYTMALKPEVYCSALGMAFCEGSPPHSLYWTFRLHVLPRLLPGWFSWQCEQCCVLLSGKNKSLHPVDVASEIKGQGPFLLFYHRSSPEKKPIKCSYRAQAFAITLNQFNYIWTVLSWL